MKILTLVAPGRTDLITLLMAGKTVGLGKTSKHSGGDDDRKEHTHDESPDAEHKGKDSDPDQVLRDDSSACK